MLEQERYNRALTAHEKSRDHRLDPTFTDWSDHNYLHYLLSVEYEHQQLTYGQQPRDKRSPADMEKIDTSILLPELIQYLRNPYTIEILGMPRAGKTTAIARYLQELWERGERSRVFHVKEGVRIVKEIAGDMRTTDPFSYTMIGGLITLSESISAAKHGSEAILNDRGQIDRVAFLRADLLEAIKCRFPKLYEQTVKQQTARPKTVHPLAIELGERLGVDPEKILLISEEMGEVEMSYSEVRGFYEGMDLRIKTPQTF